MGDVEARQAPDPLGIPRGDRPRDARSDAGPHEVEGRPGTIQRVRNFDDVLGVFLDVILLHSLWSGAGAESPKIGRHGSKPHCRQGWDLWCHSQLLRGSPVQQDQQRRVFGPVGQGGEGKAGALISIDSITEYASMSAATLQADHFGGRGERMRSIPRPEPGESPRTQSSTSILFPTDVLDHMSSCLESTVEFFERIPGVVLSEPHRPGEWTVKQILQHISDDERIYAYRGAQVRSERSDELPSFDQEVVAANSDADMRPLSSLLTEYVTVREATLSLFEGVPEAALESGGRREWRADERTGCRVPHRRSRSPSPRQPCGSTTT